MKKLTIVFVILCISNNVLMSQSKPSYTDFEKTEIFSEKFVDNQNNWRKFYVKIKKGRYVVETIGKDEASITTIPIKLDTNRNYEIETIVSIEWNRKNDFMGIVWNRDLDNGYYFGFNKDLETKIFVKNYNSENVLKSIKKSISLYPKYTRNIITIRKVDDEYYIFVNKILLAQIPCHKYYGDHFGYFVGEAAELRVYSLTVSYLE